MRYETAQQQFGDNLRRLRSERGFTQESLALHCGLHRAYVSATERGEYNISIGNIVHLARALDVTVSDLVNGIQ